MQILVLMASRYASQYVAAVKLQYIGNVVFIRARFKAFLPSTLIRSPLYLGSNKGPSADQPALSTQLQCGTGNGVQCRPIGVGLNKYLTTVRWTSRAIQQEASNQDNVSVPRHKIHELLADEERSRRPPPAQRKRSLGKAHG